MSLGTDVPDGLDGADGTGGAEGTDGTDGTDGADGADGVDGADGDSSIIGQVFDVVLSFNALLPTATFLVPVVF